MTGVRLPVRAVFGSPNTRVADCRRSRRMMTRILVQKISLRSPCWLCLPPSSADVHAGAARANRTQNPSPSPPPLLLPLP